MRRYCYIVRDDTNYTTGIYTSALKAVRSVPFEKRERVLAIVKAVKADGIWYDMDDTEYCITRHTLR